MLTDYILDKLSGYKVVSFDVFDTLIKRNVGKPEDVFYLVEKAYNLSNRRHVSDFRKLRQDAYRMAEKKAIGKACTLEDIYKEINLPDEMKNKLKQLEIKIEIEICTPEKEVKELLLQLKKRGKKILIISDMYLSQGIITKILTKCGITEADYDRLFISGEWGCRKTDGGLFLTACKEADVSMHEMAHIGDNWKNDYVRALMCGIFPVHISESKNKIPYFCDKELSGEDKILYAALNNVANNLIYSDCSEFEKLGIGTLGIYMYGFVTWLYRMMKQDGIHKVYFLAREGRIIKKCFEKLYPHCEIETEYMYASRRSIIIPSYWVDASYSSVCNSMSRSMNMTLNDFFNRLNLNIGDYDKLLEKLNIPDDYTYDGSQMEGDQTLQTLYKELRDDVIQKSREEYESLELYLKQINFIGGKSAIVDIGWNGGMQKALEKFPCIMKSETLIYGYYFGINSAMLGTRFDHVRGYIYEYERDLTYRYYIYGFAGPFEMALTADHGSTCCYMLEGDRVEPQLLPNEYRDSNGKPSKEMESILEIQKGIIKFITAISYQKTLMLFNVPSQVAFCNYFRFATQPSRKHLLLYEGFKAVDLKSDQILINRQFRQLFGKNSIMNGLRCSTWKIGFLKYIFRLPLPYKDIYLLLRKRRG